MATITHSNTVVQNLLSSGVPVNTCGLPALPDELYLEILRHLPALPIPHDVWVHEDPDPYTQLTLYYLSQTCQSMRKFFLSYAWERIEVFEGMWTPTGSSNGGLDLDDKKLVEEILRQLETITVRNPDLRQHVSVVNLTIPKYSHDSVLPKIAQNLSLCPNFHTLQLVFPLHPLLPGKEFFSPFRYPNVHTLSLSHLNSNPDIFMACPNTKHFSLYKDLGSRYDIPYLLANKCAGRIEKLGVIVGLESNLAAVVEGLPRLRDLSLEPYNLRSQANFDSLSSLPLHTIRLRLNYWGRNRYFVCATQDERRQWIELAKRILAECPQHEAKRVMVVNLDNTVEVFSV